MTMSGELRRVVGESGSLGLPAILVHGGAGTFERVHGKSDELRLCEGLTRALDAGWAVLAGDRSALEAVVEAVACLEDSGRFNAGRGSVTTSAGDHEFDAGVMDGTTRKAGSICAATWPANPVKVARAVAAIGGAPDGPLLLAGRGADRFALDSGFPQMTPEMLASPSGEGGADPGDERAPLSTNGTVGAVAVDRSGNVAAATSTGGRSGQLPGRVGDSPIPGAGVWAASDTAAISATGAGEAFVLAGFGHRIDWQMREGAELSPAVTTGLDEVARLGGDGGAIAVCRDGSFAALFNSRAMARGWRDPSGHTVLVYPGA